MVGAPLVVCADDYAITEKTSAVILDLLARRAINATTCLVESADWQVAAKPLRQLADAEAGLAVGLHLNLTDPFPATPVPQARAGLLTHIAKAFLPSDVKRAAAIFASFRAQWLAFVEHFGRTPDFIDGHLHVHLFPASRAALLRLIGDTGFVGWVRQCETSSSRVTLKRYILDPYSRALSADAHKAGIVLNPGFGGLRRFQPSENIATLWCTDMAAFAEGGLLMVHPGAAHGATAEENLDACRVQEAALLKSAVWRDILGESGMVLSRDAVHPWLP